MKKDDLRLLPAFAFVATLLGTPFLLTCALREPASAVGEQTASGWFMAYQVQLPPLDKRGEAVAAPVFFAEQETVDALCGGKNRILACARIGGGFIVLPNPCQARFAGESFAAVACHEKGHTLGWSHGG